MREKIVILAIGIVFLANISYAHRVDVFCWVDAGTIKCMAKFSTGDAVVKGTFKVFEGNKLIFTGTGDRKGNFSYKIPDRILKHPKDLKIVCIAEMGHKNYWIVRKDELSSTVSSQEDNSVDNENFLEEKSPSVNSKPVAIDYNKLKEIVSVVVDKKLVPIREDLAELKEPKLSFRDILGGIGYIMGIMGIIMYFKSRA